MSYNIKTEAGRALWADINLTTGAGVWGVVGRGIEAIEAEVEERIIKLLVAESKCDSGVGHEFDEKCFCHAIELIKGENK